MQIDLSCPVEMSRYSLPQNEAEPCLFTLRNVSGNVIISVELLFICCDNMGRELVRQIVPLNDLKVAPRDLFEARIQTLEWHDVNQVNLIVQKTCFEDGTIWRKGKGELYYYEPNDLPNGRDLDHLRFVAGEDCVGYPAKMGNLWICVCGRPNHDQDAYCARCGRSAVEVLTCFSHEDVEQTICDRQEALKAQSRQALAANTELQSRREGEFVSRRRKTKKMLKGLAVLAVVLGLGALGYFVGWPAYKYQAAVKDMEAGSYDTAYSRFISLHEYKDAAELADVCLRAKADTYFAIKTLDGYEQAKRIYTDLGERQNGNEMLLECDYAIADLYAHEGAYERAAELYQELDDYKDSKKLLEQVILKQAVAMMSGNNYTSARFLLSGLTQTDEVKQNMARCAYEIGRGYMNDGNWAAALEELEPLGDYQDAMSLCTQANYELGQEKMLQGDNDTALEHFKRAGEYADSQELIKQCAGELGEEAMAEGDWERALAYFEQFSDDENSFILADACLCNLTKEQMDAGEYEAALTRLSSVTEENKSDKAKQLEMECSYILATEALNNKDYVAAEELFEEAGDYADSAKQLQAVRYDLALLDMENGDNERALERFERLGDYKKSAANAKICRYELGISAMESKDYEKAIACFSALGGYKKSKQYLSEAKLKRAQEQIDAGNSAEAEELLLGENSYEAAEMVEAIRLEKGAKLEAEGKTEEALKIYRTMTGSSQALQRIRAIYYQLGVKYEADGDWLKAGEAYFDADDYEDAKESSNRCFEKLYGNVPQQARDAMEAGNYRTAVQKLSSIPLTEKCYENSDLPDLYKQAMLSYADQLYRAGKPYLAMPYYQALGDWQDTFEKKLNRRAYLIIGEWEGSNGTKAEFRTDGTYTFGNESGYFRVSNFSLYTGKTEDDLSLSFRLNNISKTEMSMSDLRGKKTVDYRFTRVGYWELPEGSVPTGNEEVDLTKKENNTTENKPTVEFVIIEPETQITEESDGDFEVDSDAEAG